MKKILFYLFAVLTGSYSSQTLSGPQLDSKSNGVAFLNSFVSKDGTNVWVCGEMGRLMKLETDGKFVEKFRLKNGCSFNDIAFLDDNLSGWAVGENGTIFYTNDGGNTWHMHLSNTKANLVGISVEDDSGIIYGKDGTVLIIEHNIIGPNLIAFQYNTSLTGCVAGNGHNIAYGVDSHIFLYTGNGRWNDNLSKNLEIGSITEIKYCKGKQSFIGISDRGVIFEINMGANVLQRITKLPSIKGESNLISICVDEKLENIWILTANGKIYKCGKNRIWELAHSFNLFNTPNWTPNLIKIECSADGNFLLACGRNNSTAMFKNGSWTENLKPSFNIRKAFYNADLDETIVVGDNGLFAKYRPPDIFENLNTLNYNVNFKDLIYKKNENCYYMVGDTQGVFKCKLPNYEISRDYKGRRNKNCFNAIATDKSGNIDIVVGENAAVVYRIASEMEFGWRPDYAFDEKNEAFYDVFISDQYVLVTGETGNVFRKPINDLFLSGHWEEHSLSTNKHIIGTSIAFSPDLSTAFITTSGNLKEENLFKSLDGGASWEEVKSIDSKGLSLTRVKFQNQNELFVTSQNGVIFRSWDAGLTWYEIFPAKTTKSINDIAFPINHSPVFFGNDGLLLQTNESERIIPITSFSFDLVHGHFVPALNNNDSSRLTGLKIKLSLLSNDKKTCYDEALNPIGSINNFSLWPQNSFELGDELNVQLALFDGWNVFKVDTPITIGESFFTIFARKMYWLKDGGKNVVSISDFITRQLALLSALYVLVIFSLYLFLPITFIKLHEAICRSKLPYPQKLSKFLMLYLITSDRCLTAFVNHYMDSALKLFDSNPDVQNRQYWVPAPLKINEKKIISFHSNKLEYIAGLSEMRQLLTPDRFFISIIAQGGSGKSSFAFQLARWAYCGTTGHKLFDKPAIPLLINRLEMNLDDKCKAKIKYLTNNKIVSGTLISALLKKRRVFVVVDGISEMSGFKKEYLDPEKGAKYTQAIVFTSRKPLNFPATKISPLGLDLMTLDGLIEGFTTAFVGIDGFGEHREILREKVKFMMTEMNYHYQFKSIPLILLRLIIERAAVLMRNDGHLENLPKSINSLFDEYVADLLRNHAKPDKMVKELRRASIVSLGLGEMLSPNFIRILNPNSFKPQWLSEDYYLKFLSEKDLNYLIHSGILQRSGELGDKQLKYAYDTLAEYLVAREICIYFRDHIFPERVMQTFLTDCQTSNEALYNLIDKLIKDLPSTPKPAATSN